MRRLPHFVCTALALAIALPGAAQNVEQDYPKRPIRFIVPIATGGGVDTMARTIGALLTQRLGQQVVVDNRPGAGGSLGAEIVAQATPDGYTAMVTSSSFLIHSLLYRARYDPVRDFAAVTQIVQHPYVLLVNSSVPATTAGEFIAWAKVPGRNVNYASSGNGSLIHLSGELFNTMAGLKMVHIPYKGLAQAYPEMFSGQVHATFGSILSSLPHITSGRLRALGVTSLRRTPRLPDAPTLNESGVPGFEVTQWYGAFVPAKTPAALISRLQKEIAFVLTQPETANRIASEGSQAVGNTASEFARAVQAERLKWNDVIQRTGIRVE
ncbi:MAG: tripartite tricarboxylate transporter substrate binding protein [Burkholderiales bacterium]|nr:tripartite tricarboxylate transporter substrate binding protein [Burkholderiales bacterium]